MSLNMLLPFRVSFRFKVKIVSGHIRLSRIALQNTVKINGNGGRFSVGLMMCGIVGVVRAINKRVFRSTQEKWSQNAENKYQIKK